MKIAIFHNYMDNIGGAEHATLIMARELRADIYTTNINQTMIEKLGFNTDRIFSIGRVPINAPWRQQATQVRFHFLNISDKYDFFIISGDWALSAARNHHPNLWYVYSPIREIWDLHEYTRQHTVLIWKRPIFDAWVWGNRKLNIYYLRHVEKIACISSVVRDRLKKYLDKEAVIIYPPVDTDKYFYAKSGDYWLSVSRLITHKRIETQIEAFRQLSNKRLIIVGSYEKSVHFQKYVKRMQAIKPPNVEIISWVDKNKLLELYANCRGFITTSMNEDFGLTAIEAMASGKPVIAPNEGGYKETVINDKTGVLIDNLNTESLAEAIIAMEKNLGQYKEAAQEQAKKFDTKVFINKLLAAIKT